MVVASVVTHCLCLRMLSNSGNCLQLAWRSTFLNLSCSSIPPVSVWAAGGSLVHIQGRESHSTPHCLSLRSLLDTKLLWQLGVSQPRECTLAAMAGLTCRSLIIRKKINTPWHSKEHEPNEVFQQYFPSKSQMEAVLNNLL